MREAVTIVSLGGLLAGMAIAIAIANHGAAHWYDANVAGLILLVPILGLAAATGFTARWCERGRPVAPARPSGAPAPTVALGREERAVWVGRAKSGPMLNAGIAIGVALGAATLLSVVPSGWQFLAPLVIVAVSLVWASEVRVTVATEGVRVGFGPLGAPSRLVALAKIEKAEAIDVDPLHWGGWGYRWGGRGRTAVIVRRGPGILIRKRDGRTMVVTIDGAGQAAGLVNDLIARRT